MIDRAQLHAQDVRVTVAARRLEITNSQFVAAAMRAAGLFGPDGERASGKAWSVEAIYAAVNLALELLEASS